ncbi:unnamed protein product [Haemonchus placei]|uniref:Protein phosphatase 1 regulatory subunit 15A n=1 Tax=Haemonchus placei TaxID=6290 RepID=A0A158QKX6_HAEPC|nr:unnamed protein product [Haemonchus placei]
MGDASHSGAVAEPIWHLIVGRVTALGSPKQTLQPFHGKLLIVVVFPTAIVMQELSASELSMLWLLRGRHTTKQAVEKAILNELPLWPEAVHLARAYHRSKKDLAGGKYYIIGSDFVENERNSPYSYHELEKEEGRGSFEADKSKPIQLPLAGDGLTEFQSLYPDSNPLDVCQIFEDGSSECEAGGVDVARLALGHSASELQVATVSAEEESAMATQEASPSAPPLCQESLEQGQSAAVELLPSKEDPKERAILSEAAISTDSKQAAVPENERPASPLKKPIFDFSEFESEIMRQCERLFRPRSPVRNFSRVLSLEDFQELSMRDEGLMAFAKDRENSTSGNSEMEDVEAAVLAEFDKIDEELEQAIMNGDVMESGEELNTGDPLSRDASTSEKEKPKRCYVYPFDDSSSVICSDFSDDDNIGTNIFMEISEHRRVEGASSPSSCSDDSDATPPPNVFVWLPQTWTYDINLVTQFRSPSPNAKCDVVLTAPERESVQLTVTEPKRTRISGTFTYSKNAYHAGAFSRRRGARLGSATSFTCSASKNEIVNVDCDISNPLLSADSCQTEIAERISEQVSFNCKASKEETSSVACAFCRHPTKNEYYLAELVERPSEYAALTCQAPEVHNVNLSDEFHNKALDNVGYAMEVRPTCSFASVSLSCSGPKYEELNSSWVFEVQIGSGTAVTIRDMVQCKAMLECKASTTREITRRPLLSRLPPMKRKHHETSMEECLLLLELGAMPSQSIDDPCPQNSPSSSTSSGKVKNKTRRKDLKGCIASSSSSGRSQAVNLKEVSAALSTISGKPTTRRSLLESTSSQRSDLSDSPDRLVIVEDLEGVIVKDPPPDEMPVQQNVLEEQRSSEASSSFSNQSGSLVMLKTENEASIEAPSVPSPKKSLRKRELEACSLDILPPQVKRRVATTSRENAPPSAELRTKTMRKTKDTSPRHFILRGKRDSRVSEEKTSCSDPTPDVSKMSKHLVALTDRKTMESSQNHSSDPLMEAASVLPRTVRTSTATQRDPKLEQLDSPNTHAVARRSGAEIEAGSFFGSFSAVASKASKVILPCGTTVIVPSKIHPRPVSEFPSFPMDVDSFMGPTTRLGTASSGLEARQEVPRRSREAKKLERSGPSKKFVDIAVVLTPKPRFRSCVGVSIVTEESEAVQATFKEYRAIVDVKHGDKSFASKLPIVTEIPEDHESWDVGGSKPVTRMRTPTRRSSKNLQVKGSLRTPSKPISSSVSGAKTPVSVAGASSKNSPSVADVFPNSKTLRSHDSRQDGSSSITQTSAIPTRSRKCQSSFSEAQLSTEHQSVASIKAKYASNFVGKTLLKSVVEPSPSPPPTTHDSQRKSERIKRTNETAESSVAQKRMRTSLPETKSEHPPQNHSFSQHLEQESQSVQPRRKSSRLNASAQSESVSSPTLSDNSGIRLRRKSSTPPILVVAVEVTSSFVPVKRDNERSANPITLPTYNFAEAATTTIFSSDSAEILNALALEIIINEASALSTVNMATFAQFVFNLFEPVTPIFGKLIDIEPSNLPANFTTIFERASPLQFRHRLDYNSFNTMLMNRLPENGLHALTLDSRKVSMLKITKFVDTIKESVSEICEELRTRRTLSKGEIQTEKDLSSEVQHLITSRYVETMMKLADACHKAKNVPAKVIADRFYLLLCGWNCFLQQGGALRVRLQLSPMRSHPGIVDVTTAWLDQIDAILSRAQATLSTRTSAFAVSLAQEKNVMLKIWQKMAAQTSPTCNDE